MILCRDIGSLQYFLKKGHSALREVNYYGQTPIHLAVDQPAMLELLIPVIDKELINQSDRFGHTAIELAMALSMTKCSARNPWSRCKKCQCARAVTMLLKADCGLSRGVSTGEGYHDIYEFFRMASLRCKKKYVHHLKDRRRRLAEKGRLYTPDLLNHLTCDNVLDAEAGLIARRLDSIGVQLDPSLAVLRIKGSQAGPYDLHLSELDPHIELSVFHYAQDEDTATFFYNQGFQIPPIEELYIHDWFSQTIFLGLYNFTYLRWLIRHASSGPLLTSCITKSSRLGDGSTPAPGTTIAHLLMYQIFAPKFGSMTLREYGTTEIIEFRNLVSEVLWQGNCRDNCRCACTKEGCSPLTVLFKITSEGYHAKALAPASFARDVIEFFGACLDRDQLKELVNFLTFTALEITHTCCRFTFLPRTTPRAKIVKEHNDEDILEIQNLESDKLDLLNQLMVEFDAILSQLFSSTSEESELDVISDFISGLWTERIGEVQETLAKEQELQIASMDKADVVTLQPVVDTFSEGWNSDFVEDCIESCIEDFNKIMSEALKK